MSARLSIKLVADRANVAVSTVSRVLNNSGYVSNDTREKVLAVVKELGYRRNKLARTLRKRASSFIGLIVPHLIRLIWGPDYRNLVPLSILGGATTLLIADLLARTLLAPQEIPVGVITALAGAPFFLWVLRRSQRGVSQV